MAILKLVWQTPITDHEMLLMLCAQHEELVEALAKSQAIIYDMANQQERLIRRINKLEEGMK